MRVIFASQRIEFTIGYRIDAAKWDADKQRVKNGCTNKLKQSASDNNTDLLRYYTIMQEVFKEYEVKDIMPTPQEIKDSIYNKVNPTEEVQEEQKNITHFYNRYKDVKLFEKIISKIIFSKDSRREKMLLLSIKFEIDRNITIYETGRRYFDEIEMENVNDDAAVKYLDEIEAQVRVTNQCGAEFLEVAAL